MIPETFPNKDNVIKDIKDKYNKVLVEKKLYEDHFQKEFKERDLMKRNHLKAQS